VTEPGQTRLRPGHWLLLGIVALLVTGGVLVVLRRDRSQPESEPTSAPTASANSAAGPVCLPKVTETGFSDRDGAITFGLAVASDCPQAVVNSFIDVAVVGKKGDELTTDQASTSISLPVLLPGQRIGLGGTVIVEEPAVSLKTGVSQTQNIPADAFASWPKTVQVADIRHTGPDSSGHSQVTGTVVTDPASVTLCNPQFFLVLRNKAGKIMFGAGPEKTGPTFDERLPSGVDWSTAEISVAMGVATLGILSGAELSCQS
jgi:hypothetical protein